MRQLIWEKAFSRALKRAIKRQPSLRNEFELTLNLLEQDAFAPSLETHKLKGKLAGLWACSADTISALSLTLFRSKVSRKLIFGCWK